MSWGSALYPPKDGTSEEKHSEPDLDADAALGGVQDSPPGRAQGHTILKKAYFFVAALPASACLYEEPFRAMESHSRITAHVNAFTYFGGVPRILVPDSCKTSVQKADYYDPDINRTYWEMARH